MAVHLLSERKRDALRLDLEDQQRSLIEGLWRLSQNLSARKDGPELRAVPDDGVEAPGEVATVDPRLVDDVDRLRKISEALRRLQHAGYGTCRNCGAEIPFPLLAQDPTLELCPRCWGD